MLADTRIISRHRDYLVLAEHQAVVFRDNSIVHLHQVQRDVVDKHQVQRIVPDTYLRAFCMDEHWCVFDLRSIHSSFAVDFPALLSRDHPGVVLYTLRQHFPGGEAEFIARAFKEFQHVWTEPDAQVEPLIIAGDYPVERIVFQPELRRAA